MAIKSVRTKGKGGIFTQQQLTSDLKALADQIKDFMFTEMQKGGKHQLKKSGGIIEKTTVEVTTDGVKLALPEYAQYVDGGRLPFTKKVPLDSLIKWIRRYRVSGRDSKGKFVKRVDKSVNSLAYAIQTSIYKKGIKARPFLEKTIKFGEELISQYIEEALIPDIITLIDFNFKGNKNK